MEERFSEEERKEIEKLLYEISNLQVRASVLSSKNAKCEGLDQLIQIGGEEVTLLGELNNINVAFSETTLKLSKLLNSPAIEKTMNKISQSNVYNKEMVGPYLDQLVKEMKSVAEKTKSIIDSENIKRQIKQEQEKQERQEEQRREAKKNLQTVPVKTETQKKGKKQEEKDMKISK